jgi:signal transduction histidine kinase
MWSISFLLIIELFVSIGILLAVALIRNETELIYTAYLLFINSLFLVFYFRQLIKQGMAQQQKLLELLKEQDRSSKLLIRRDLELTRANDKLRALDTQKSEFISVVAHQMRTPLSAMKWTLTMLLKGDLGNLSVDQQTFIGKAEESNDHMISLVEDMLLADKLDTGHAEVVKGEANMNEIVNQVLHDVQSKFDAKKIKVHYTGCDDLICKVNADKDKMRSVVQNLLENAGRYTPEGGSVTIQVYEEHGNLHMSVTDSGIGIPKDQQAYIFTKFYRARNASKLEANGSGLGLFISKSIVEKHGGGLEFESEEGKGTTFRFWIPKA